MGAVERWFLKNWELTHCAVDKDSKASQHVQIYNTWITKDDVEDTVGDKEGGEAKEANNTAEERV